MQRALINGKLLDDVYPISERYYGLDVTEVFKMLEATDQLNIDTNMIFSEAPYLYLAYEMYRIIMIRTEGRRALDTFIAYLEESKHKPVHERILYLMKDPQAAIRSINDKYDDNNQFIYTYYGRFCAIVTTLYIIENIGTVSRDIVTGERIMLSLGYYPFDERLDSYNVVVAGTCEVLRKVGDKPGCITNVFRSLSLKLSCMRCVGYNCTISRIGAELYVPYLFNLQSTQPDGISSYDTYCERVIASGLKYRSDIKWLCIRLIYDRIQDINIKRIAARLIVNNANLSNSPKAIDIKRYILADIRSRGSVI